METEAPMSTPAVTGEPFAPASAEGQQRRRMILFGLLGLLGGAWIWIQVDQRNLAHDLSPLTAHHERDLTEAGLELASVITVTRPYILYGAPHAKIQVFRRQARQGDGRIQGVEYSYARGAEGWTLVESAGCTGEVCQVQGKAAFDQDSTL